jgi:hydroxyquinol 1,2-dioxygenase
MTRTVDVSAVAAEITSAALHSFDGCEDARLRLIMRALVSHLHAFATEVQLTEEEWMAAIHVLTATGHLTNEQRQEFILWSDALGLSMLVDARAHPSLATNGITESTVLGPFWTPEAPLRAHGESISEQPSSGMPAYVYGRRPRGRRPSAPRRHHRPVVCRCQ